MVPGLAAVVLTDNGAKQTKSLHTKNMNSSPKRCRIPVDDAMVLRLEPMGLAVEATLPGWVAMGRVLGIRGSGVL